ncbi:hypothetical protein AHF37_05579 [Paragonimus kellicotti]|nr:hypothetical protein AHF37_05579 [Paragonimus kellicotti]
MISKVQRLANMSAFALFFYSLMVIHMVFVLGGPKFILRVPLSRMNWWRPAGLIPCSPIFFASIFCQTQLHTVYAGMQYPSVSAIRYVVRVVVIVIAVAYGLFGFFGYVAFVDSGDLPGNIFLMYPNNMLTFVVQAGFLFTITVSIPLVFFPLRQSLHSFLFHRTPSLIVDGETGEDGSVPTKRFRLMTVGILITCFLLSLTTSKMSLEKAPITELFSVPDKVVGEAESQSENTRIQQSTSKPVLDDTNKIEVNERQVSGNDKIRSNNSIVKTPDPEVIPNQTHFENAERIFVSSSPDGHAIRYPSNGSNMTLNLANKEELVESIPVLPIVEPNNYSIPVVPKAIIPASVESILRTESGSSSQTDGVTSRNSENLSNRSGLMNKTDETVPHPKSIAISEDNRIPSDIEVPLEMLPPAAHSHTNVSNGSEVVPNDSGNSALLDSNIDVRLSGNNSVLSPVKRTIPDVFSPTAVSTVESVYLEEGKPPGKSDAVAPKKPESLVPRPIEMNSNEVVVPHKSVLMPVEPEESLSVDIEVIIQLTSSLAGSLIGYILPGLAAFYAFAHHHFHKSSMERRRGTGLLCVGLFLLVSGLLAVHHHQNSPPISMPLGVRDPHGPVDNMEQISKHISIQDFQNDIHVPSIDKRNEHALSPNQPGRRPEDSLVDKSSIVSGEKLVNGKIDISHNTVHQRRPAPIQTAERVEPVASVHNVSQTPNSFASLTPAPLKVDRNSGAGRLIGSPQRGAIFVDNRTENELSPSASFKHEKFEPNVLKVTSASNGDSKHIVSLEKAPITELFSVPDKVVGEAESQSENTRIQQSTSKPVLDDTNKIEVNERQVSGNDKIRSNNSIVKTPDPEVIPNQTHFENAERIFVSSSPDGHAIRYPSNGSNMTLNLANKEELVESIPVLPIVEPNNYSIPVVPKAIIPASVESILRTESGSSSQTDGVTSRNSENLSNRSGLMNKTDETVPHPKSIAISEDNRIPSDIEVPLEMLPPAAHSHTNVSNGSEVVPNDSGNSALLDSNIDVRLSGNNSVLSPVKRTIPDVFSPTAVSTVESVYLEEGKPPGKSDAVAPKKPESLVPRPIEMNSNEVVVPHKSVLMPVEPEESLSVDSKLISNLKPAVPPSQNNKDNVNKYPDDPLPKVHIETR